MRYAPNVEATRFLLREVWPFVSVPGAKLLIAGSGGTPDLAREVDGTPGARWVGYVPDTGLFLRQAAAFVAPLLAGGGTKLKVLEALAAGRPVVTTSVGAQGIPLEHERNALLADNPEEIARQLSRLLVDPELARRLGEGGHQMAAENFSWAQIRANVANDAARHMT